jgi:MOSC domain-containing protein
MRVVSLWRYPVKSMQGEELETAEIGTLGIVGDRQWALVDLGTGLALTARRVPELLFASARLVGDDAVAITLPDGTITTEDAALSAWLGRDIELRHAGGGVTGRYEIALDFEDEGGSDWFQWDGPDGTFHDSGKTRVSVLGTGSIGAWDRRRFRGNVLVATDAVGAENELVGHRVEVGSVVLDVTKPIDRCVMTTRPQPGGIERDLDVLRTINAERQTWLGVGTLVVHGGSVAVGDELRVLDRVP